MFFHVCTLEPHKQLQINTPEKLLKDKTVPRGEDATDVKGYIRVLNPSPSQSNNPSSFPCCRKMVGMEKGERGVWDCLLRVPCNHVLSPHSVVETSATSPLPSPRSGQCRSVLSEGFQEPELCLLFDQTPDSFCMRGGDEPIRYTCHKLFLDH